MNVPTVNVVMTYNPAKMMKFQETGSLEMFKRLEDEDVQVFSNSPNSNFISLTHDFNYDSAGGGEGNYPRVEIEFIDPKGIFDDRLNFNPHTLLDPNDDLVAQALEKKREELDVFELAANKNEQYLLKQKWDAFTDEMANASYYGLTPPTNAEGQTWNTLTKSWNNRNPEIQEELDDWALWEAEQRKDEAWWIKTGNPVEGYAELLKNKTDNAWVQARIDTLRKEVKDLEEYDGKKEVALIQKQIDAYNGTLNQSIWITYGVGDDLRDWCPPMCFNQVTMVEFSFDATKGRTMKLIYGGEGEEHPNLTPMGILPLGSLGLGAVFNGTSRRIFSKDAHEQLLLDYPDLADAALPSAGIARAVWKPSLHKIITDTLKSFLQSSTNSRNVLVLFPNLDKLLANYYKQEYESVKSSNADKNYTNDTEQIVGDNVWNIEATKEALEGLGFTMSCSRNSYKGRMGDSIFNALERQVDDVVVWNPNRPALRGVISNPKKLGTPASPESVLDWLEDRDFRCELSTNGLYDTVKDKLTSVGEKLTNTIANTYGEAKPFTVGWFYETDYNVLRVLEGYGLIKDGTKPALIFGEQNTIRYVLEGRFYEDTPPPTDDTYDYTANVTSVLHDFDIEDGYHMNLMKELYEIEMPIPWLGPFGPTANENIENFLPGDTNLDSTAYETIKKEQPNRFSRMPIFSFGTKNPNILNFNMDINKQYTKLLGTCNYIVDPAFGVTTAILAPNAQECEDACNLLSMATEFQTVTFTGPVNKDGVPIDFVDIATKFWEEKKGSTGGTLLQSSDLDEVLAILAPEYTLDREFEGKEDFVFYLWSAFCSLTQGDVPRSSLRLRGVNPIKQMLNNHIGIADILSRESYLGTIKTVPMFHLSTARRAVAREAVVLGIEPKFFGTDSKSPPPTATWFSGIYLLNGFKHTITKGGVYSEFAVAKPLSTGGFIN